MAEKARKSVKIRDFPGLGTRIDPNDLATGASREQTNVQSHRPGELRVRSGTRQLTFEED